MSPVCIEYRIIRFILWGQIINQSSDRGSYENKMKFGTCSCSSWEKLAEVLPSPPWTNIRPQPDPLQTVLAPASVHSTYDFNVRFFDSNEEIEIHNFLAMTGPIAEGVVFLSRHAQKAGKNNSNSNTERLIITVQGTHLWLLCTEWGQFKFSRFIIFMRHLRSS